MNSQFPYYFPKNIKIQIPYNNPITYEIPFPY